MSVMISTLTPSIVWVIDLRTSWVKHVEHIGRSKVHTGFW